MLVIFAPAAHNKISNSKHGSPGMLYKGVMDKKVFSHLLLLKYKLLLCLQELKKHLLFYKMCDVDAELGFVMYDILPQIRKKTLDNFELKS